MWLVTPIGFFSVVEKPEDTTAGTLTVRARVRADLERLREQHLPALGEIQAGGGTDYRFRARAPRSEVAAALAHLAETVDYDNFKNVVSARQGHERADLYADVWEVLYRLQRDPD